MCVRCCAVPFVCPPARTHLGVLLVVVVQILLVPAAFTKPTGEAHWEILLRARAIECQCYVMAAAQTGRHNEKRESYGHAMIIDPWGQVLARCARTFVSHRSAHL